jgi:hypothetical protein
VISTSKVGTEMSGNVASAKSNVTEPSTPTPAAVPTGYRVAVVPGAWRYLLASGPLRRFAIS